MVEPVRKPIAQPSAQAAALGLVALVLGMFVLAEGAVPRHVLAEPDGRLAEPPVEAWSRGPELSVGFAFIEAITSSPQLAEPRWSPLAAPLESGTARHAAGHSSTRTGGLNLPAAATLATWHVRLQI